MYDLASPLLSAAVRPPTGPDQPFQPTGSPDEPFLPPQSSFQRRWGEMRPSENVERQSPLDSYAANFKALNDKTTGFARNLLHPERAFLQQMIEKWLQHHIADPMDIHSMQQGATAKDSQLARDAGINDISHKPRDIMDNNARQYEHDNPGYPRMDAGKLIQMILEAIASGEIFQGGLSGLKQRPPMQQRPPQLPQRLGELPTDLTRGIMAGA